MAGKDNIRETMYAEVLNLIASYETGVAHEFAAAALHQGRKLTMQEAETLFSQFERHPLFKPPCIGAAVDCEMGA
ncbi:hypothetical protein [Paraburkholderia sp. BL6669N2]|uniref:hypothetical protein n=1 Tax=Paraburkholderia sp. BL6669N2 TaxID=1938807 RepID=UPI0015F281EB|nr:hypothetical protein [Paraburkholderia sp. BL6669N2]